MRLRFLLPLLALPVQAQADPFTLPEGCTAYVTIQSKSCLVTHHYTCQGDPEGHQWRVDIDGEGPVYAGRIDAETQWIESFDLLLGIRDTLDANPKDPGSFTELTRTGRDDFEFSQTADGGDTVYYRGRDLLTGRTVVIDDVPLLETETYARATDANGKMIWESTGNEYLHLDWRIFIGGSYVTRTQDDTINDEGGPVDFIFPGEDGFLSDTPEHNCNTLIL